MTSTPPASRRRATPRVQAFAPTIPRVSLAAYSSRSERKGQNPKKRKILRGQGRKPKNTTVVPPSAILGPEVDHTSEVLTSSFIESSRKDFHFPPVTLSPRREIKANHGEAFRIPNDFYP